MDQKLRCGIGVLEHLYGGITREYNFTDDMTDEEIFKDLEKAGYVWDESRKLWLDANIEQAIENGYLPSEIWGQGNGMEDD